MTKDPKTIVNIKLRAGQRAFDVWSLVKIAAVVALLFAVFAMIQLAVCAGEDPPRGLRACLAPGLREK